MADVSAILRETLEQSRMIAIAGGVSDAEQTLEMAAFGLREVRQEAPVTLEDQWHIGSISKSLTSMLLGTFIMEGRLDLDATLPELLPHLAKDMHPDWQQTTLREVLEQRAGLPANFGLKVMLARSLPLSERRARRAEALAGILARPAGPRRFLYSNVGYTLAGHVAETITNELWEELIIRRIFTPLGLKSAGFGPPMGAARLDHPVGHSSIFGLYLKPQNPFDGPADNTPIIGPAGTVHMSVPDLLSYGRALLTMAQGQDGLLSATIFEDLTTPHQGGYTAGLIQENADWAGGGFFWHNGSNGSWYALLVVLPEKNRVIAITTNQESATIRTALWQAMGRIAGIP